MYTFAYNIWILYILRMYIYISYMYIHLKKYDIYIYSIKILGHWKNLWIFFTLYKHSPLLPTCSKHFFRVCSPRYILKQTLNESLTWRGKKKKRERTTHGTWTPDIIWPKHQKVYHPHGQATSTWVMSGREVGDKKRQKHEDFLFPSRKKSVTSLKGEEIWAWFEAVTSS